jgi:alpha-tubulin suppressor-like RCC1 family protein
LLLQVFNLIILENGFAYGFGNNSNGQLGIGNTNIKDTPTEIILLRDLEIDDIYCGNGFTIAVSEGLILN